MNKNSLINMLVFLIIVMVIIRIIGRNYIEQVVPWNSAGIIHFRPHNNINKLS